MWSKQNRHKDFVGYVTAEYNDIMAETVPTYAVDSELAPPAAQSFVVPYEQLLARDVRWAMSEGSLFFEGKGRVQRPPSSGLHASFTSCKYPMPSLVEWPSLLTVTAALPKVLTS